MTRSSAEGLTDWNTSFMNAVTGLSNRSNAAGPHHVGFGASSPLVSPTSTHSSGAKTQKRTQSTAGLESSAGSGDDVDEAGELRKRQPGVKRACNECRQQKVNRASSSPAFSDGVDSG